MEKPAYLNLQWSESVVAIVASQIFAAYIQAGKAADSNEDEMLLKSVRTAIKLAEKTDAMIKSDDEGKA